MIRLGELVGLAILTFILFLGLPLYEHMLVLAAWFLYWVAIAAHYRGAPIE